MIDKNIVDYLNKYYKDYPLEDLKQQLSQSGYSPVDIEESVQYIQRGGLTNSEGGPALTPGKNWPWLRITVISGVVILVTVTGYFIFRGFFGSTEEVLSGATKTVQQSAETQPTQKPAETAQFRVECNPIAGQKVLVASADLEATYKDDDFPLFLDTAKGFLENKTLSIDPLYDLEPSICAKHFENVDNEAIVSIILNDGEKAAARIIMLKARAGTLTFSSEDFGNPSRLTLSIVDPDNPQKSPNLYFKSGSMTVGPNPLKPNEEMLINFRDLGGVDGIDGTAPVFRLNGTIKLLLPSKLVLTAPGFLPTCSSLGGELCPKIKECGIPIIARDNSATQQCCTKNFCGTKLQN